MIHYSKQSGFSLVETLVAITILLVVIIGPMTISSSAAKSTSFASEQVTAFFLAQEGAELIEKARNDLLLEHFLVRILTRGLILQELEQVVYTDFVTTR